ncbi:MAG TPA: MASE1 domain-containing protein [Ktedonobacteraceae bacterium]
MSSRPQGAGRPGLLAMKELEVGMRGKCHPLQRRDVGWYGLALLTLAAVYVSVGRLGLSVETVSHFATLVWLPSGLAVAALFLWGNRLWPAILLGAFLTNLFTDAPVPVAIGISLGNTLEAVVCVALLRRVRVHPALSCVRDVLVLLLLAAPLSALLSATVGVGSLLLGGIVGWSAVPVTWSTWWCGDLMSLLLLTPLLFTWHGWSHAPFARWRLLEMGLLSLFVLVVGLFVFLKMFRPRHWIYPDSYFVFPPLIWVAMRFGPRGATAAIAAFAGLAVGGTIHGVSPFSAGTLWLRLLLLQSYLGVIVTTTLILAAIVAERRTLEQRKDDFITMASHELRTPLTSMLGYTQLLQKRLAGSDQSRTLQTLARIEAQARQLSRLVSDLLTLSRIRVGELTFVEEPVEVDTLVREVVDHIQQTSARHHLCVQGCVSGKIPGDRERLSQAVGNLLTNAIKYSPEATQVLVHLTSSAEDLTISIQDFGIGIPKGEQKKIFERFYRAAGRRNQTIVGLGIGLFITSQIIHHYHGQLWVESVEGQGSTFSIRLPWKQS